MSFNVFCALRFGNSVMALHVLVSLMVSESGENGAEKHLVFTGTISFVHSGIILVRCSVLPGSSSASLIVLGRALELGFPERSFSTDCTYALAL